MMRANWLIVGCLCWLIVSATGNCLADEDVNKYNVLFIAIDDLRPELGCYGAHHAQSPHLDAFARESLRFDRHYVQVATCGSSRFALLTGRSPRNSGVTGGNNAFYAGKTAFSQTELKAAQSMPELFRRSGYKTSLIGKISHTADGLVYQYDGSGDGRHEVPNAWDELLTPLGSWQRGWGIFFAYADGKHREDGGGNLDLLQFTAQRDADLPDGLLAETAIAQLKKHKEQGDRFFMGLGFFKPHLPFVAPQQDWDAFADSDIPLPPESKIDSPYWHKSGEFYKYKTTHEKSNPLSDDAIRSCKRGYLACVRYVDRQVGKVLEAVRELELADDTVVVVWGDHGWHLGEQQIWAKHTPFERANRSVLMIRVPGMRTSGRSTASLAETIDIYPTLVEVCNPSFRLVKHKLDGKSLVPILRHERTRVRDVAISYWRDAVSVRDEQFRLIAKMDGPTASHTELYDVSNNPDSIEDLSQLQPAKRIELLKHIRP